MKKQIKINNFSNYFISEDGNVWSTSANKMLKFSYNRTKGGNKYAFVILYDADGIRHKRYIHRLVAEHFIEKEEGCNWVNHKDNNGLNNNIENLEWVSALSNKAHGKLFNDKYYSKYIGITYHKKNNKWLAFIFKDGKQKYLGSYITEEEARDAYLKNKINIEKYV